MHPNAKVQTLSIGEYLINKYGDDAIARFWSDKNNENPFNVAYKSNRKFWFKCGSSEIHDDYLRTCDKVVRATDMNTCPICTGHKIVKGVNDIATIRPDLVKYFVNIEDTHKYSHSSGRKVLLKCPDCGSEKYQVIHSLNKYGLSCNACGDGISYPNKFMFNVLTQLNIVFEAEYSPKWAIDENGSQRRYDFYIPSKNLIIEMDGGLGHGNELHKSSKKTMKELCDIDKWKEDVAINNGLSMLRVDCNYTSHSKFTYIKDNVIDKISEVFILDTIDWNIVETSCAKSIVKEVCDEWDTGEYSVRDISEKFKISGTTMRKYLKTGDSIGWCKYDAKFEVGKTGAINGLKSSKPVLVFKDGEMVGRFNSCTELVDKSYDTYGVHFTAGRISSVCHGVCKTHKGYVMKFDN